jgi:hypothetical protein
MPGFDGTGPQGKGPLTGRGEGYCAIRLPDAHSDGEAYGYAGLIGLPVRLGRRWGLRFLRTVGARQWRDPSRRGLRNWWW